MGVRFEALDLTTLGEFDPKVTALFKKHITHVAQDCVNRPGDNTARTVTLTFSIVPDMDADGTCESANVSVKMVSSVPQYKTKALPVLVTNQGFKFNRDIPDSLDQAALPGTVDE